MTPAIVVKMYTGITNQVRIGAILSLRGYPLILLLLPLETYLSITILFHKYLKLMD